MTPELSNETGKWLERFKKKNSFAEILASLKKAKDLKILLIGDTIIDEYMYCDLIGRSLKEAILRVKYLSTERFAGGVIAVANHLSSFCDNVTMLTVLGAGPENETFIKSQLLSKVKPVFFKREEAVTVVNKRIVRKAFLEKFFGIYEINDKPIPENIEVIIGESLDSLLPAHDLVIVM